MHSRFTSLTLSLFRATAGAAALLMVTVLVVGRSEASFSATTSTGSSGFAAGSVTVSDDDSGTALFSASGMEPGTPVVECITVTYSGTILPTAVRLYGSSSGNLAPYLTTTIEEGTGGEFGDCSSFVSNSTLYTGTLANFSSTHAAYTSGLTGFTAAATPASRTFRFTVTVANNNLAQGESATADFSFEAQS